MKLIRKTLLALLLAGGAVAPALSGQADPAKSGDLNAAPLGAGAFDPKGEAIFVKHCSFCHEGQVERAPSGRRAFISMPQSYIYRALTTGKMKEMAQGLSDAEKRSVTSFLSMRPFDPKAEVAPKPPLRCKRTTAWFDDRKHPSASGWGISSSSNTRFIDAKTAGITPQTVGKLKLKWAFALPNSVVARSQPAVAGGAVFIAGQGGDVYALDTGSGCAYWSANVGSPIRTSIAIDDWSSPADRPRIYFGDGFGSVFALDAKTGKQIWKKENSQTMMTGGPTLHAGRIYVPLIGTPHLTSLETTACCTGRGSVVALDSATGKLLWQSFATKTPPAETGLSPKGLPLLGPAGAGIWNSPTIDPVLNRLYVGTGESSSSPAENGAAVLAMNLDTGQIIWSFQNYPTEAYNLFCREGVANAPGCPPGWRQRKALDVSASPMLIHGADGKDMLVAMQKTGDVFGLDRESGKILWRRRITRGDFNQSNLFGMAAEGETVFAGVMDIHGDPVNDKGYWGIDELGVYAMNARTGKPGWFAPLKDHCRPGLSCRGYSAAFTATPGMVFVLGIDGWARALSTRDGSLLWDFDTRRDFPAGNGEIAHGGDIEGPGVVVADGMLFMNSGYGSGNAAHHGGNAFLAFSVK